MQYTANDYKAGQPRWCPGCGDHAFLASLHKAMPHTLFCLVSRGDVREGGPPSPSDRQDQVLSCRVFPAPALGLYSPASNTRGRSMRAMQHGLCLGLFHNADRLGSETSKPSEQLGARRNERGERQATIGWLRLLFRAVSIWHRTDCRHALIWILNVRSLSSLIAAIPVEGKSNALGKHR